MLGGTDNLLDSLCLAMDSNPSFFLGAAHCLRLSNGVRNTIGTILQSVTSTGLVYAVLVAGGQLVTLVRPRRSGLHPYDLILVRPPPAPPLLFSAGGWLGGREGGRKGGRGFASCLVGHMR